MTSNQIAYFKAKIEEQHYKQSDAETQRANKMREQQQAVALEETARSNRAHEALQSASIRESARHNAETEAQQWANINAGVALTEAKTESQHIQNALDRTYGEAERIFGNTEIGTILKSAIYAENTIKKAVGLPTTQETVKGLTTKKVYIPDTTAAKGYEAMKTRLRWSK